jgi:hypothetical protein
MKNSNEKFMTYFFNMPYIVCYHLGKNLNLY